MAEHGDAGAGAVLFLDHLVAVQQEPRGAAGAGGLPQTSVRAVGEGVVVQRDTRVSASGQGLPRTSCKYP